MAGRMVMMRFGATAPEDADFARRLYHDEVRSAIAEIPGARQVGRVEWRSYGRDEAAPFLAQAGIAPNQANDLLRWLADNPDAEFLVTSAPYEVF